MLRGRWRYLEHHWVASAGDYTFEPAGEAHTLVVPDDVQEMATLFHVTGGYTYVDPYGAALGYEDVFTKLERASRQSPSGLGRTKCGGLCDETGGESIPSAILKFRKLETFGSNRGAR